MPSTAVFVFPGPGFPMRNNSSFSSAFVVMEAAWGETRAALAIQASDYAVEAARKAAIEAANEEMYTVQFRDDEAPRARRSQRKNKATYRPWQH